MSFCCPDIFPHYAHTNKKSKNSGRQNFMRNADAPTMFLGLWLWMRALILRFALPVPAFVKITNYVRRNKKCICPTCEMYLQTMRALILTVSALATLAFANTCTDCTALVIFFIGWLFVCCLLINNDCTTLVSCIVLFVMWHHFSLLTNVMNNDLQSFARSITLFAIQFYSNAGECHQRSRHLIPGNPRSAGSILF